MFPEAELEALRKHDANFSYQTKLDKKKREIWHEWDKNNGGLLGKLLGTARQPTGRHDDDSRLEAQQAAHFELERIKGMIEDAAREAVGPAPIVLDTPTAFLLELHLAMHRLERDFPAGRVGRDAAYKELYSAFARRALRFAPIAPSITAMIAPEPASDPALGLDYLRALFEPGVSRSAIEAESPSPGTAEGEDTPRQPRICWDCESRELRVDGVHLVRFKNGAHNQVAVLKEFQAREWPGMISNPFQNLANKRSIETVIFNTLKYLNKKLGNEYPIVFSASGTRIRYRWRDARP